MSNDSALKVHYHTAVEPALSLVFEISDLNRANEFYRLLQDANTITQEGNSALLLTISDQWMKSLFKLVQDYGVTIGRDIDVTHKKELPGNLVQAFVEQEGLSEEDAQQRIMDSATGEFLKEGLLRFWVTTPNQVDLIRLHHDLNNLGRRTGECGDEPWLRPVEFRENAPLLLKTLDDITAYTKQDRFKIETGPRSYMTGLGPENSGQKNIRVVDNADAFCRPIEP